MLFSSIRSRVPSNISIGRRSNAISVYLLILRALFFIHLLTIKNHSFHFPQNSFISLNFYKFVWTIDFGKYSHLSHTQKWNKFENEKAFRLNFMFHPANESEAGFFAHKPSYSLYIRRSLSVASYLRKKKPTVICLHDRTISNVLVLTLEPSHLKFRSELKKKMTKTHSYLSANVLTHIYLPNSKFWGTIFSITMLQSELVRNAHLKSLSCVRIPSSFKLNELLINSNKISAIFYSEICVTHWEELVLWSFHCRWHWRFWKKCVNIQSSSCIFWEHTGPAFDSAFQKNQIKFYLITESLSVKLVK